MVPIQTTYKISQLFESTKRKFHYFMSRDNRKSQQKWLKNTAHFCENRKNHGITAAYIAASLLKQLQKKYILGKTHTTMTLRSHILPVSNKAHGLW